MFKKMDKLGPKESDEELALKAKQLLNDLDNELEYLQQTPVVRRRPPRPSSAKSAEGSFHSRRNIQRHPQQNPRYSWAPDSSDKLFSDLLDDVDAISGNTPSVRRRRRARDIFSDWLFSDTNAEGKQNRRKSQQSFEEYFEYEKRISGGGFISAAPVRNHNWREVARLSKLRLSEVSLNFYFNFLFNRLSVHMSS